MNRSGEYYVLWDRKRKRRLASRIFDTIADAESAARAVFRSGRHKQPQTDKFYKRLWKGDMQIRAVRLLPDWFVTPQRGAK